MIVSRVLFGAVVGQIAVFLAGCKTSPAATPAPPPPRLFAKSLVLGNKAELIEYWNYINEEVIKSYYPDSLPVSEASYSPQLRHETFHILPTASSSGMLVFRDSIFAPRASYKILQAIPFFGQNSFMGPKIGFDRKVLSPAECREAMSGVFLRFPNLEEDVVRPIKSEIEYTAKQLSATQEVPTWDKAVLLFSSEQLEALLEKDEERFLKSLLMVWTEFVDEEVSPDPPVSPGVVSYKSDRSLCFRMEFTRDASGGLVSGFRFDLEDPATGAQYRRRDMEQRMVTAFKDEPDVPMPEMPSDMFDSSQVARVVSQLDQIALDRYQLNPAYDPKYSPDAPFNVISTGVSEVKFSDDIHDDNYGFGLNYKVLKVKQSEEFTGHAYSQFRAHSFLLMMALNSFRKVRLTYSGLSSGGIVHDGKVRMEGLFASSTLITNICRKIIPQFSDESFLKQFFDWESRKVFFLIPLADLLDYSSNREENYVMKEKTFCALVVGSPEEVGDRVTQYLGYSMACYRTEPNPNAQSEPRQGELPTD